MASQFSALIQHRFSYCLAPFDDVTPRPLVLRFGEDIPQLPPQSVGSTQLIASPTSYFFYLGLKDISVADSGALFTHIDADALGGNAYAEVLKGQVQKDLNYVERPPNFDEFATLTFHFDESVYTVNGQYMHVIAPNFFCVGILKGSSVSVLGAWQQQNKRIIYDGGRGVLEFADENCMNDIA
ncbi:uncharacterized protein LOC108462670 [Gossypium arboreum]|uniref:uncharacterized protein LOC108462670 n=1 Tax=Gossypium arboreum TaxID=29729 RepID=UPI0022F1B45F|nr:uncharacterized protein LOC108462670 [Gossypium arboreum]